MKPVPPRISRRMGFRGLVSARAGRVMAKAARAEQVIKSRRYISFSGFRRRHPRGTESAQAATGCQPDGSALWSLPLAGGSLSGFNQQTAKLVNPAGQIHGVCLLNFPRITPLYLLFK